MFYSFLLLLLFLPLLNGSISDPTAEEIKLAFELVPPSSWGNQARQQNSLRILCIGGSNTANEYLKEYPGLGRGYVQLLNQYVKNKLANSYALNQGRSGVDISYFVGKKFAFEFYNDTKNWPNVIIVDTSVNGRDIPLKTFEVFLRSIVYKFKLNGLPCPDIMFYNMMNIKELFRNAPLTSEERAHFINRLYPNNQYSYSTTDDNIRQFAAHYHLPVISWRNATQSAAFRHYINASFNDVPWRYSNDGIHMSPDLGTQFGMNYLLGPFFESIMTPRSEAPFKDVSTIGRLFPPSTISVEQVSYTTLDVWHSYSMFNMSTIIHKSVSHSSWNVFQLNERHTCFGTYQENDVGELRFHIPVDCSTMYCQVSVGFVHSWNASMIGNASCVLYKHVTDVHTNVLSSLHIDGTERTQGDTGPQWSNFASNVTSGLHSIKCKNLVESRLSCLVDLMIKGIVNDV